MTSQIYSNKGGANARIVIYNHLSGAEVRIGGAQMCINGAYCSK